MGKKITLDFLRGYQLGTRRESDPVAYQYDEGHTLEVKVPTSVTTAEIQYWIRGMDKAEAYTPGEITAEEDGTYTITGNVPNSFFEHSGDLRVYVVVTDDSASTVTYEGYIHIVDRQMPEDYVDDDPDNEAVRVLAAAREAAAEAQASAEDAAGSAQAAQDILDSIPEDYSALSDEVTDLKADLSDIETETGADYFIIESANVNSSGVITASTSYDLYCFDLKYRRPKIDQFIVGGNNGALYAFYTSKPALGSTSYNNSRSTSGSDTINNLTVPSGCNWIVVRCDKGQNVTVSPFIPIFNTVVYFRGQLGTDANPNTIYRNGMYYVPSGTGSTWATSYNYPITGASRLVVLGGGGLDETNEIAKCMQFCVGIDTYYFRISDSSGVFTDWKKVATDVDIASSVANATDTLMKYLKLAADNIETFPWEQGTFDYANWAKSGATNYVRQIISLNGLYKRLCFSKASKTSRLYCYVKYSDGTTYNYGYQTAYNGYFDITDAVEVVVIWRNQSGSDVTPSTMETVSIKLISENAEKGYFHPKRLFSSFRRFGVYSDSLASGRVYTNNVGTDNKAISWPTYLTEELGNTVYNHSQHGESPDTFLTGKDHWTGAQESFGDNTAAVALDGSHDVPVCVIGYGANNHNNIQKGTITDIDASNCTNNAVSVYGMAGRLIQTISNYYAGVSTPSTTISSYTDWNGDPVTLTNPVTIPAITGKSTASPIKICILLYAVFPTGTDAKAVRDYWIEIYDKLKSTVEGQGNQLILIDLYSNNQFDMNVPFFNGDVLNNHWTSIGYNALSELIGNALSEIMWNNEGDFETIEFIDSNTRITSYSNPTNYT